MSVYWVISLPSSYCWFKSFFKWLKETFQGVLPRGGDSRGKVYHQPGSFVGFLETLTVSLSVQFFFSVHFPKLSSSIEVKFIKWKVVSHLMSHWVGSSCTWRVPWPLRFIWGHQTLAYSQMTGKERYCFQFTVRLNLQCLTHLKKKDLNSPYREFVIHS